MGINETISYHLFRMTGWSLSLFLLLITVNSAVAASVYLATDTDDICSLYLEGSIEFGDLEKLMRQHTHFSKFPPNFVPENEYWMPDTLCLNSKGGKFNVALSIAELLMERGIKTVIKEKSVCFSACAVVFMAGTNNTQTDIGILPSRRLHIFGKLGFHAPYLDLKYGQYQSERVEEAFKDAMLVIARFSEIASQMDFDHSLVSEMLRVGPKKYFEINTIDKAGRWGIALMGYDTISEITPTMYKNICRNNFSWSGKNGYAQMPFFKRLSNSSSEVWPTFGWQPLEYLEGNNDQIHRVCCPMWYEFEVSCNIEIGNESEIERRDGYRNLLHGISYVDASGLGWTEQSANFEIWSAYPPDKRLVDVPPGEFADYQY